MKFPLYTNANLAVLGDAGELRPEVEMLLNDSGNEKLVSVASFWEMTIKVTLGKLQMVRSPAAVLEDFEQQGIATVLPINAVCLRSLSFLPPYHRDPFDRLIIARAFSENCTLVSSDRKLDAYGVSRLW